MSWGPLLLERLTFCDELQLFPPPRFVTHLLRNFYFKNFQKLVFLATMHIGIVQINLIKAVYSVAANVYVSCMKPQGSTRHVYGAS